MVAPPMPPWVASSGLQSVRGPLSRQGLVGLRVGPSVIPRDRRQVLGPRGKRLILPRACPFLAGAGPGLGAEWSLQTGMCAVAARSRPSGWAWRQGRLAGLSSSADRWWPRAAGDRERVPGLRPETPGRAADSAEGCPRWRACGSGLQPEDSSGFWGCPQHGCPCAPQNQPRGSGKKGCSGCKQDRPWEPAQDRQSQDPGSLSAATRQLFLTPTPRLPRAWPDPC